MSLDSDAARAIEDLIRSTGEDAQDRIREAAPKRTGKLREAVQLTMRGSGANAEATVHAGGVAPIITGGARAHRIVPKERQAIAWPGGPHPVARANIPALPANPFVDRALEGFERRADEHLSDAADRLAELLADNIEGLA